MNRIHEAIVFAARKHAGQVRKGTDIPYISHPMEVMQILSRNDYVDDVIIGGILHDVLEDTDATQEEIIGLFGEDILDFILAESEDKSKPWKERKQATIDQLKVAPKGVKIVCLADKLANLRSMASDMEAVGDKLWERFNAPKDEIEWYYRGVAATMSVFADSKVYEEFLYLLEKVFK